MTQNLSKKFTNKNNLFIFEKNFFYICSAKKSHPFTYEASGKKEHRDFGPGVFFYFKNNITITTYADFSAEIKMFIPWRMSCK